MDAIHKWIEKSSTQQIIDKISEYRTLTRTHGSRDCNNISTLIEIMEAEIGRRS